MHVRTALTGGMLLLTAAIGTARAQGSHDVNWGPLDRLVGTWIADADSGGHPGQTTRAGETWQRDVGGHALVRRDFSEYPATATTPAFRHEGFMVVTPNQDATFS